MDEQNRSKKSRYEDTSSSNGESSTKIEGVAVLMKKSFLQLNDIAASVVDRVDEIRGRKVALQLITTASIDHDSGNNAPLFQLLLADLSS